MNLYVITLDSRRKLHVIAEDQSEAVDIFVTFEASRGRFHEAFVAKNIAVTDLCAEQEAQVIDVLVLGIPGILHNDGDFGWVFSSPLCTPVGPGDPPTAGKEEGK